MLSFLCGVGGGLAAFSFSVTSGVLKFIILAAGMALLAYSIIMLSKG